MIRTKELIPIAAMVNSKRLSAPAIATAVLFGDCVAQVFELASKAEAKHYAFVRMIHNARTGVTLRGLNFLFHRFTLVFPPSIARAFIWIDRESDHFCLNFWSSGIHVLRRFETN